MKPAERFVSLALVCSACSAAIAFDVATLKPSPPSSGDSIDINLGAAREGRVTLTNVTLAECVMFAYGISSSAQVIGPDWIQTRAVRFDILAKAAPDTEREKLLAMLQSLLAERLNLKGHWEKRPLPHLALVVGKNGLKLKPAEGSDTNPASYGHISRSQITMPLLATLLSRFERQVIVDETELTGPFAVELHWSRDNETASVPTIYTAVEEQLGLKLETRKGPIDVFVVDSADKVPKAN